PNVAISRSNLANILGDLGEHAAAREQIQLALDSDLKQFGPDHPKVAIRHTNLAAILTDGLGDHREALKQIELALAIFRKKLPAQHPYIRTTEGWRATILRRLGHDS
ncbi:MAG: tetratricopeptide repeat protein, partial [Bryobacterales bacterium]|nr:tetratricopeptide repeat protein [Bryobacterales bacterium]